MKKFFITLLILVILGGAVFFIGWVQLAVPPGSYGIIQSKTHGIDPVPVRSGEFRWVWYKLIPTNVKIAVFRLTPQKFSIDFDSSLPSGGSYASFAGLSDADFSWNLNAEISFNLDSEKLVTLAAEQKAVDQETLEAYIQETVQDIKVIILGALSSAETDASRIERLLSGSSDAEMEKEVYYRFPEIRDFSFVTLNAKYPDFVLYKQIRLLYEDFLEKQREYVTAGFARRAENHIEAQFRFWELEQYGELLTKYPVLLEYLSMNLDKVEQ
jgi:hypothetical protein